MNGEDVFVSKKLIQELSDYLAVETKENKLQNNLGTESALPAWVGGVAGAATYLASKVGVW